MSDMLEQSCSTEREEDERRDQRKANDEPITQGTFLKICDIQKLIEKAKDLKSK